jgi:hypothetical protein
MTHQRFTATIADAGRGRVLIPVPFQPDTTWGAKPRHHIHGTVNGMSMRTVVEPVGDGFGFTLGPAWLRGCRLRSHSAPTVRARGEQLVTKIS